MSLRVGPELSSLNLQSGWQLEAILAMRVLLTRWDGDRLCDTLGMCGKHSQDMHVDSGWLS